jgi:solute carrier family 25 iron transporter 28/37
MFGASIPAHAAYFSIFEACKRSFGADGPDHTPLAAGAAGVVATIAHDGIMTPWDVVKQRLQLGYYRGTMDCLRSVIRYEGPGALYLSLPTTLLMNLPYGMVMVAANETCKKAINPSGEHHVGIYLSSGALAGAMAGALTNPLDVVKTRLQTQSMLEEPLSSSTPPCKAMGSAKGALLDVPSTCGRVKAQSTLSEPKLRHQYNGLLDASRQIYTQEGIKGFFRGMWPRLFVHAPSVAISWTTYEVTKKMLQRANE